MPVRKALRGVRNFFEDWRVAVLFATVMVVFIVGQLQAAGGRADERTTRRNADMRIERETRDSYVQSCQVRNASIVDGNETRDATADLLEGLGNLITDLQQPEIRQVLDEAVMRQRVLIPLQDCSYPPTGRTVPAPKP